MVIPKHLAEKMLVNFFLVKPEVEHYPSSVQLVL